MTFRKSKLIHKRPGWPLLKHDALITKTRVMSAITELTPRKKTGRGKKSLSPSVRDNCRLCMVFKQFTPG